VLVDLLALGLGIGTVDPTHTGTLLPVQTQPAQVFKQPMNVLFPTALSIGILDAQQEYTAVFTGQQRIEQGSPYIA
jgi:hypothetical protein